VEVFVYLMTFSQTQLDSDDAVELKQKDLSKIAKKPVTSDQLLYEISEIKLNMTNQLMDAIKESAFDCYIYSDGSKCVNFANPTNESFAYVPDLNNQPSDTTAKINKKMISWKGQPITIGGVTYIYKQVSETSKELYDLQSYEQALKNPAITPLQKGTLESLPNGELRFTPF
jgi:hypothetical protein